VVIKFWHSEHRASWCICIMKANQVHYFSDLFDKVLYTFRTCPLSIIRNIWTLYTAIHASSVGCLLADTNRTSMTNTYCVYTVLRYSWSWAVDLSETCRVLYQINLRNSASCWLSLYECGHQVFNQLFVNLYCHLTFILLKIFVVLCFMFMDYTCVLEKLFCYKNYSADIRHF
jgi:hypothetical protein